MSVDPLIGQQLANFRVERLLGRGGMAEVYFGRDVSLQRPVAIKVLNRYYRDDPAYAQQFIQEARSVAAWRHENIVQIHYADHYMHLYYFVMEYVDGLDLGGLLKHYQSDDELMQHGDVIRIGNAVAGALDYAHQKGVIHRDIKPSNVMISTDNRIILTDFGLAMTVAGEPVSQAFGTPHYIAPEQARDSASAVPESDIYSLGVMLYEMLTGSLPFNDPSPASVALKHLALEPPPPREINPTLNPQTETVLLKALSKEPEQRYRTGYELMRALEAALQSEPKTSDSEALSPVLAAIIAPAISSMTLADKLRLHQQRKATALNYPDPISNVEGVAIPGVFATAGSIVTPVKRAELFWFFAGLSIAGILIAAGLIIYFLLLSGDDGNNVQAEIAATIPPTEIVNAATDETPSPEDTQTSALPSPTTSNPPTDVASAPTVMYPDGRLFIFFYNENSFYIYNASGSPASLDEFTFERLDANDVPNNRMEGGRFARYAPRRQVMASWCVEFEIPNSPAYLSPEECQGVNSHISPARNSSLIFWTASEDSTQFRILWNGEEVARCEIIAGECEARLP